MARLLRTSRGNSGLRLAWLAVWLQQRRRRRQFGSSGLTPGAPVITNGLFDNDATTPGYADAVIDFTFDDAGLPVGTFEVWGASEGTGWEFALLDTIPSTARSYRQVNAVPTDVQATVALELRYRHGAVIGPFSDPYYVLP